MLHINNGFKSVQVSKANISIANGSTIWESISAPDKAIGIIGYYISGTGNTKCSLYAWRFTGNGSCNFALYNGSGAAATLTLYVDFLVKN